MGSIRFAHANLIAKDWGRLARFYEEAFECTRIPPERSLAGESIESLTAIDKAMIRGVHLALPGYGPNGPTLEIFQYDPEGRCDTHKVNDLGFGHIAFEVDDVQRMLERVIAAGGQAVGALVRIEIANAGTVSVIYARDVEGNIIEIQQWS